MIMHNYFQHVWLFLKRLLWLLLFYSATRVFFFFLNTGYFSDISLWAFIKIFLAGIRFDIAAIVFSNAVFLLFLLPGRYKNIPAIQKVYLILFFAINGLMLLSNCIDAKFFSFINKRSTSSIFGLMGTNKDVWLLLPQFLKDYWYVALAWILLMVLFWRWMPRLKKENLVEEKTSITAGFAQVLVFGLIFGFMLLGARGTGVKPIGIIDAASYAELKDVPLVLNTPFSIMKTVENENIKAYHFFGKDSLEQVYKPIQQYNNHHAPRRLNVVIFILESFSKEYSAYLSGGEGYTPNLDSILRKSLVFPNAFANGTQSYEAMPAIIAGIPSLMDKPYSGSNYAGNVIESLPYLLKQEGYHSTFFHGGNNGTMGFSKFASVAGIEHYMGRNEYHNDADYDGHWGIWDEPFLQYFANQLNSYQQPFFSSVFTLSSHHPYEVPAKYKGRFQEGSLPILKSIRYADYALGQFFKTASRMPWYKNTLFVFSADHAAQAMERIYNSTTGRYSITLGFFCPSDTSLKGINPEVAQQIDIMPTVLDYLGYSKPFFSFGNSLFDNQARHRAIIFVNNIYQLVEGDYVMTFDGERVTSFFDRNYSPVDQQKNVILKPEEKGTYQQMETDLKAMIQTYNDCLINNRCYPGEYTK
jgi:phosphoglycerol transferase MdoB-like AlkP superfamily enzyme